MSAIIFNGTIRPICGLNSFQFLVRPTDGCALNGTVIIISCSSLMIPFLCSRHQCHHHWDRSIRHSLTLLRTIQLDHHHNTSRENRTHTFISLTGSTPSHHRNKAHLLISTSIFGNQQQTFLIRMVSAKIRLAVHDRLDRRPKMNSDHLTLLMW